MDDYTKLYDTVNRRRGPTGLIYYPNKEHVNVWNDNFPECPERAKAIYSRLLELGLVDRCTIITADTSINIDDLTEALHSKEAIENFRKACEENSKENGEACYDSVYYNGVGSLDNAKTAALCCVTLASKVARGELQNGFAIVRPPGHHVYREPNGYCLFNNVALSARYLLDNGLAEKILIVDFDVHHGQGTQRCFYENDRVVYFSIHRYEHGKFWPHLEESHSRFVGRRSGRGYNLNVPLNETGLGDTEYVAIVVNLLLPLVFLYSPDIILVSAGYDSSLGCPKGSMNVTPAFYGHLMTLLEGAVGGKIACMLEGGYYLPSLAEGVAMTVKSLLGDPCVPLMLNQTINKSVIDSINDVRFYLYSVGHFFTPKLTEHIPFHGLFNPHEEHLVIQRYHGEKPKPPYIMNDDSMSRRNNEDLILKKFKYIQSFYHKNKSGVLWMCDEHCDTSIIIKENLNDRLTIEEGTVRNFAQKLYTSELNFGVTLTSSLTENVATIADVIIKENGAKKIVIMDFNDDDKIQTATYERDDILYIKICCVTGTNLDINRIGKGLGCGHNIIIPLRHPAEFIDFDMENIDLHLLSELIIPLVYSYCPDLIIMNRKFEVEHTIRPEATKFGQLIQMLKAIAKVLVVEESNVKNDRYVLLTTLTCLKVMLGDPLISANVDFRRTYHMHLRNNSILYKLYWPFLQIMKKTVDNIFTEDGIHGLQVNELD